MAAAMQAMTQELETARGDLLACADERDLLSQQHQDLVAEHAKATVELQDVVGQQAELEKLCEDMNQQIKTLEDSLAKTSADKQALEGEREQDIKVMESLKDQVKTKEASLAANQQVRAPFTRAPPRRLCITLRAWLLSLGFPFHPFNLCITLRAWLLRLGFPFHPFKPIHYTGAATPPLATTHAPVRVHRPDCSIGSCPRPLDTRARAHTHSLI